jgi:hypothetical protein
VDGLLVRLICGRFPGPNNMYTVYWYDWYVYGLLVRLLCVRFTGTIVMCTVYWYDCYVYGLLVRLICIRFTGTIDMYRIHWYDWYVEGLLAWLLRILSTRHLRRVSEDDSFQLNHLFRHSSFLHIHVYRKIFDAM